MEKKIPDPYISLYFPCADYSQITGYAHTDAKRVEWVRITGFDPEPIRGAFVHG